MKKPTLEEFRIESIKLTLELEKYREERKITHAQMMCAASKFIASTGAALGMTNEHFQEVLRTIYADFIDGDKYFRNGMKEEEEDE